MRPLEDFFDNRRVARIGEGGQSSIDAEIVERCEYRVPVSFCCLFVVLGQRKKKFQYLFLWYTG